MNIQNVEVVAECICGNTEYEIVDNGEFGIKPDSTGSDLGYRIYADYCATFDKAWISVTVQHCHTNEEMNWIEKIGLTSEEEFCLADKMIAAKKRIATEKNPPVLQKYA